MSFNTNALQNTPLTYVHPWYSQLQLLESSTTSESESTQKQSKDNHGQTPTSYCFSCKQDLPLDEFNKNNNRRVGVQRECRSCQIKYYRARKSAGQIPEGQMCECCKIKPAVTWDHDHATEQHRGWLCQGCNRGLGAFEDDPALLTKAIDYLSTPV